MQISCAIRCGISSRNCNHSHFLICCWRQTERRAFRFLTGFAVLVQVSDAVLDACLEQDPQSKVRPAAISNPRWTSRVVESHVLGTQLGAAAFHLI